MIIYTPPKPAETLPVIDLSGSFSGDGDARRAVAYEIHKACRDTGFFYVSGHGVPLEMMEGQLNWARRFFALPEASKRAISVARSDCMRGYEPPQMQTLDVGSPSDLKESFMMARGLGPEHPYVQKKVPNQGPNQWPGDLPGFREHTEAYHREVIGLGIHLMRLLALSLELPEDHFDDGLAEPMCSVRLLHYPPQPADAAFNQIGAGAHTDWGSLTMLLQDDVGGLEVQNAAGDWVSATPVPGAFVINLGDMVRRWTNDIYHSTMHRVRNNTSDRDRYSVASFFNPEHFYQVECVPTCMPEDGKPLYAPCTVGEHIAEMFRLTYDQKKTA